VARSHADCAAKRSTAAGTASATTSSYPAAAIRRAMGAPMLPRPMKPTRSLLSMLVDDLGGRAEAVHRRSHATVDGRLQKHLSDLLLREPVVERAAHVGFHFVRAAESGEHGEVDHAAFLAGEPLARPGAAPAVFVQELLQAPVEIRHVVH